MKFKIILYIFASSAVFFSASAQAPTFIPSNGLIGWWPFNGDANDESGNGHDGITVGTTLTADRYGDANKAYAFNGTSNFIEVADASELRLANTDFTISFWVYINTYVNVGTTTCYVTKRGIGQENGWIISSGIGYDYRIELKTSRGSDPNVVSDSTMSLNEWHSVIIVYHSANKLADIYVDNELDISESNSGFDYGSAANSEMRFGHDTSPSAGAYFLNGKMDDIAIWGRALTETEIDNVFNGKTTDIEEVAAAQFNIFPNPTSETVTVNVMPESVGLEYTILDANGRILTNGKTTGETTVIDISQFATGNYFFRMGNTAKVIIKQ